MVTTIPTRDGGTVQISRRGPLVDIHVRNAEGRTVATVVRRAGEAERLLSGKHATTERQSPCGVREFTEPRE